MSDSELQAQVDAQLLEQGAFAVLELLSSSGRLLQSDYEVWRRGDIDYLDEVLMGAKDKIKVEIEAAARYAQSIGLVQQVQTFHAWGSPGRPVGRAGAQERPQDPPALKISADPELNRLIASRFVPRASAPQMDLFLDNAVVALTSGIVRALAAGDRDETQRLLDRLYAQAPNHADLAGFDRLLTALGHLHRTVDDPRRELDYLIDIGATAKRLMGFEARDLLAPLWRQLAHAIGDRAFSREEPALHRSFALIQAQDWAAASDSVDAEPEWWLHGPLCVRRAESCFYQHRRAEALMSWFPLCWRSPSEAGEALGHPRQPDGVVAGWWRQFLDSQDDLNLDTPDFPAWLLLQEPRWARALPEVMPGGNTPAAEHYRCVHRWLAARRARQHGEEMALRKTLQAGNPALFKILMQAV